MSKFLYFCTNEFGHQILKKSIDFIPLLIILLIIISLKNKNTNKGSIF